MTETTLVALLLAGVRRGEPRKLVEHHRDQPCVPARAGRAGDVLQDPARSGQGPEG